ncbi:DUF4228 domain-containing protein [Cephalotus follicularis]|uniref:DUF4228 domain-containing protein n=1 Tax=Cephalotus follicularis TaxID=3775 RepID=A0A1Q3ATF0_CEPFO|nr:DUF4228 domain-containing protein [Cephalotus follicularis]
MGGCFSCRSSYSFNTNILVVHLNGYVEEFEHPVLVSQFTANPPGQFVCTPVQLLKSFNGTRPLNPDALLEPGQIYFLLPYSTLQPDVSPVDLVSISRKLTAIAKSKRSSRTSALLSQEASLTCGMWGSPANSPDRISDAWASGGRSWKPILDTITEKSFTRRSESDLQEMHLETFNSLNLR